ncbi:hypothetical protein HanHA300_Chr11g0416101 [Helianthus annuus]|nr:hypothetical protein HanHA300_Chr11g0416101 [Helianthus annuus]
MLDRMQHNEVDQIEYMAEEEEKDIPDFLYHVDEEQEQQQEERSGDENLDDLFKLMKVTDTSATQARAGKDIQGIPWKRLSITRESYRRTRLEQYKNYQNIPSSGDAIDKEYKQTSKDGNYYEFFRNSRALKPTILHFQLRNLVWATSKHDVYFLSDYSIMHWSSLSQNSTEIVIFSGHVAPTEKHAGSLFEGFTKTQISTLAVKDDFLVVGGFQGELACKRLDTEGVSFCTRATNEGNVITNAIEIYNTLSGGMHFMASNNDHGVREYDMDGFQLVNHFHFPWPVNVRFLKWMGWGPVGGFGHGLKWV